MGIEFGSNKNKELVRPPTEEELQEVKAHIISTGQDEENAENMIRIYWFGVFDHYISDSPGYSGKVLFAVWGLPELYELYIWDNGKIRPIEQDSGMRRRK